MTRPEIAAHLRAFMPCFMLTDISFEIIAIAIYCAEVRVEMTALANIKHLVMIASSVEVLYSLWAKVVPTQESTIR